MLFKAHLFPNCIRSMKKGKAIPSPAHRGESKVIHQYTGAVIEYYYQDNQTNSFDEPNYRQG
jgi:hypothetical protein